jgi:alkylhydroperoxidase/carboxymuconolactone decarboxylase family protein YurZ
MAESRGTSSGFSTGLNLADLDAFAPDEAERLISWYQDAHGDGDADLFAFVPFLIENRPAALKLYRSYVSTIAAHGQLPQIVPALIFLNFYMLIGNERGARYEVVAARRWGASKTEVLDVIERAFLSAGPFGANTAATARAFMASWPADEPRALAQPWPDHWIQAPGMTLPHEATGRLLAQRAPEVLAALRARRAPSESPRALPTAMLPVLDLHASVALSRPDLAAEAAEAALAAGLTAAEVIEVIGFGALYASPAGFDKVAAALDPILSRAAVPTPD